MEIFRRCCLKVRSPPLRERPPPDALLHAAQRGDIQFLQELLALDVETADMQAAMCAAVRFSRCEIADALLKVGADRSIYDMCDTALSLAAEYGRVRIIGLIARYIPQAFLAAPAAEALRVAAEQKDSNCVRVLLESGAPVSSSSPGFPSALFAAARSDAECVKVLLQAGGDPNECDEEGRTPLHHAAIAGEPACAHLLLAHGAEMLIDNFGATPVDVATTEAVRRVLCPHVVEVA